MTTSPSDPVTDDLAARRSRQLGRCVEPVEGLVHGAIYEVVRWKRHPLFPHINLAVVRNHKTGVYPNGEDYGYSPKRFVRAE